MARTCIPAGLPVLLFVIVLITGCGSDSVCPNEEQLTIEWRRIKILTSPNYPASYGNNQNCSWKITTESADYVVYVHVVNLVLETDVACSFDSLSIYDSDEPVFYRRLAKLCGYGVRNKSFTSTGRHMYLKFVSDHSVTRSGFELHISAVRRGDATPNPIPTPTTQTTTTTTTTTTSPDFLSGAKLHWNEYAQFHRMAYLTSSNYPGGSLPSANSVWTIRCLPGYVVQLHIVEMDLQTSSHCGKNRVTVYDTDGTVLATMCNFRFEGVDLYSSGSYIYVRLTTGSSHVGKGFSLRYQAVWPYEARPWSTPIPPWSYTTTDSPDTDLGVNYALLIGVMTASAFMVCVCCVIIAACCRRRRPSRPSVGRPATSTLRTTRSSHNDRAMNVFPRPSVSPTAPPPSAPFYTNPAFSAHSEGPPPYSSLNTTTLHTVMEEPPSYSEAMIMTHPPGYKDVSEETLPGPVTLGMSTNGVIGPADSTAVSDVPDSVSGSPSVPENDVEQDRAPDNTIPYFI